MKTADQSREAAVASLTNALKGAMGTLQVPDGNAGNVLAALALATGEAEWLRGPLREMAKRFQGSMLPHEIDSMNTVTSLAGPAYEDPRLLGALRSAIAAFSNTLQTIEESWDDRPPSHRTEHARAEFYFALAQYATFAQAVRLRAKLFNVLVRAVQDCDGEMHHESDADARIESFTDAGSA